MKTFTTQLLGRAATALVAAGACAVAAAPAAFATPASAPAPKAPSGADVTAARHASETAPVMHTLAGFLAHHGQPANHNSVAAEKKAEAAAAPKLVGATVPVYYLNPAFVKGRSASVPVAEMAFMATEAVSADGQHASVWTVKSRAAGHPWKQFNIASGSDETDAAAAAARHGAGAVAFYEPQIHAWYVLDHGRVTGINKDGRQSVGSSGMTVTAYQALVHKRYADKLPGSDYARNHMVGGFDYNPVRPTTATADDGSDTPAQAALGGGAAAVALAAGAFTMRRRRARRGNA
ncbi:hypothetical protein [Streptomyces anandii]|uniref:Uncharacterized protein n=1 Tax=Streptomyces anandii TaxID=285454 RepID=A0ABW6HAQ1_9ACTN